LLLLANVVFDDNAHIVGRNRPGSCTFHILRASFCSVSAKQSNVRADAARGTVRLLGLAIRRNEVDLENEDDEDHRLKGASSPTSLDPASIHRATSSWIQEESARQLTEYTAKAHEEKLRAIRLVEDTYRAEIAELRGRLEKYESQEGAAIATTQTRHSRNSFEFPATNKEMIRAFKRFVSDYVVKSQQEKVRAVAEAEEKVKARYESIISELTRQIDEFKP
jgi:hypothetical protein